MAEQLKLTIEIGGVDKAYRNVNELVKIIKEAENTLKTGTFSNKEQFTQLGDDISQAKKLLRSLKKEGADLRPPAALEDFADFGQFVTSSFGLATSAIELFGGKSEDVARAAAKAQQILTLAYTAQQTAVGLVRLRTVALAVAQTALAISTNVTNKALKALFLTISTNPMTALLTVAGLLVGTLLSLTNQTEDATEANDELNLSLTAVNDKYEQQIQVLQARGAAETEILKVRLRQAKELEIIEEDEFVRLQRINRFAPEVEQQRIRLIKARGETEVAQLRLTKTEENELEKVRKDSATKQKERIEALIAARIADIKNIESLSKVIATLTEDEVEVEEVLNRNIGAAQNYASAIEGLRNIVSEYGVLQGNLKEESDSFYPVFDQLRTSAEDYFDKLSSGSMELKDVQKGFKDFRDELLRVQGLSLSDKEKQLLLDYTEGYSTLYEVLSQYQKPPFDIKDYEKLVIDLALAQNKITVDPFKRTPEDIAIAKVNIQSYYAEVEKEFVKNYVDLKLPEITKKTALNPEQLKKTKDELGELGKSVFANLVASGQQIAVFEQGSEAANLRIKDLNKELELLAKNAREGFIIQNIEKLTQQFELPIDKIIGDREKLVKVEKEISSKRFDTQKTFQKDITDLEKSLLEEGIDISEFNYATKLMIYKAFLEKQVEATEEAETETERIQKERIDRVLEYIQNIQSVLNSLGQTTQDFFQLQFDRIEREYAGLQDSIIGDTEKANALRLKSEEDYQTQRKNLEKRAAITQLSISLGQSIANTAEAITKAYAQFGAAGFIPAAIVAGLTAVQTGIITAQIANISRYQKGGVIEFQQVYKKGQGGLVVGPSHEMGGVKYQQGGVELEGGESVINRVSSVRYQGLLSEINQAGGGRPLVMNNFDDSRIVEAIARQRKEPLRAYVLESDITEKQAVTKRLEQLSQI